MVIPPEEQVRELALSNMPATKMTPSGENQTLPDQHIAILNIKIMTIRVLPKGSVEQIILRILNISSKIGETTNPFFSGMAVKNRTEFMKRAPGKIWVKN